MKFLLNFTSSLKSHSFTNLFANACFKISSIRAAYDRKNNRFYYDIDYIIENKKSENDDNNHLNEDIEKSEFIDCLKNLLNE